MKIVKIIALIIGVLTGKMIAHLLFSRKKYAVIGGSYDR